MVPTRPDSQEAMMMMMLMMMIMMMITNCCISLGMVLVDTHGIAKPIRSKFLWFHREPPHENAALNLHHLQLQFDITKYNSEYLINL